ncbi:MAG: pyridoxal-phosphate dependent enzyme [Acidobacteria bacterium]|nr:MAG: pyridoxal-phosphate dependent enzyme [Acidobacteriota bacterium]
MNAPAFRCAGCGAVVGAVPCPFRCPNGREGDDIDHVLVPVPMHDTSWPDAPGPLDGAETFSRYAPLLSSWRLALSRGLSGDEYRRLSVGLDRAVEAVDGSGFRITPFIPQERLAARLGFEEGGRLWVKDETRNVSGSHKARHLMGVMLYLLVAERAGMSVRLEAALRLGGPRSGREGGGPEGISGRPPLAIASCGNAALAAAVVARAAEWPLHVFVPPSANPAVLGRLDALGARITTCHRQPGVAGDPCYLSFKTALREGALPFCCQGSDNGLTIEGGETLAWEMVDQVLAGCKPPAASCQLPDAVFVQVGGGALASAVVQGFEAARRLGVIDRVPAVTAVQTAGGYPLARAYQRLTARLPGPGGLCRGDVEDALSYARMHRSEFMWPWEQEPRSIAHGILDDETYDWAAVVEGLLNSGGRPVVVREERLQEANELARSLTGIDVDHTGSAGLAGLMDVLAEEPALRRARVAVIFSGVRRAADGKKVAGGGR